MHEHIAVDYLSWFGPRHFSDTLACSAKRYLCATDKTYLQNYRKDQCVALKCKGVHLIDRKWPVLKSTILQGSGSIKTLG